MTKKYSAHLKLPFECNFEDAARQTVLSDPKFWKGNNAHVFFDKAKLGKDLPAWLGTKNLKITHSEVFYIPPHSMITPHIDSAGEQERQILKMNWQFGGKGSRMMWFHEKPGFSSERAHTEIGTPYFPLELRNLNFVESVELGSPTMVMVSAPHMVLNNTDDGLFILALPISNQSLNLAWEEIPDLFREVLL